MSIISLILSFIGSSISLILLSCKPLNCNARCYQLSIFTVLHSIHCCQIAMFTSLIEASPDLNRDIASFIFKTSSPARTRRRFCLSRNFFTSFFSSVVGSNGSQPISPSFSLSESTFPLRFSRRSLNGINSMNSSLATLRRYRPEKRV